MNKTWQITARGHANVRGTHRTTLEITRETFLTTKGDCIIGVAAEAACNDLPEWLRDAIRAGKRVKVTFECDGRSESLVGTGHPGLILQDPVSMVFRTSQFTCGRTILVGCDKAAVDFSRDLVTTLADPEARLVIKFTVEV